MSIKEINEKTAVPIKLAVIIVASAVSASWWIGRSLDRIEHQLSIGWTVHDSRAWGRDFADKNPTVKVPDADEIFWKTRKPIEAVQVTKP